MGISSVSSVLFFDFLVYFSFIVLPSELKLIYLTNVIYILPTCKVNLQSLTVGPIFHSTLIFKRYLLRGILYLSMFIYTFTYGTSVTRNVLTVRI